MQYKTYMHGIVYKELVLTCELPVARYRMVSASLSAGEICGRWVHWYSRWYKYGLTLA